jgi:cobalt transporter subunit CbtA
VTPKDALLWGGAGFVAVQLAPGIGLPPELPGTVGADLAARQVWWLTTVLSTAAALGCFAFGRNLLVIGLGAVLLVAPHIIGAPHLDGYFGVAPPELSGEYVARSLAVGMAAWVVLGLAAGYFWNRQPKASAT